MSNCLPDKLTTGGIFEDTTIIRGKLIDAILTNPTITGGISIDSATADQLADQLCAPLGTCIDNTLRTILSTSTIDKVSFTNAIIEGLNLKGLVTLNEDAKKSLYSELQAQIDAEINSAITAALAKELTNIKVKGLTVSDSITIDDKVTTLLSDALKQTLTDILPFVNTDNGLANNLSVLGGKVSSSTVVGSNVSQTTGSDNTFSGTTLNDSTFKGSVAATPEAIEDFAKLLAQDILKQLVENNAFDGLTIKDGIFDAPNIQGDVSLDADAIKALVDSLTKGIIKNITDNKLFDGIDLSGVNIKGNVSLDPAAIANIINALNQEAHAWKVNGGQINSSTGTGNTFTSDTYVTPTLKGEVLLDEDAKTSLCDSLKSCLVSAVITELAKDCTPILTSDAYPPINESSSMSTQFYGDAQDIRLGSPLGFMNINGYAVPFYKITKS